MSAPIKIAELQRLDAEAAPGPWDWSDTGSARHFTRVHYDLPTGGQLDLASFRVWAENDDANARLTTAMRNALPALLRLAVATHRRRHAQLKNRGTYEDALERADADTEEREALAAFDFSSEEPSA